jgi:hypothetical protein
MVLEIKNYPESKIFILDNGLTPYTSENAHEIAVRIKNQTGVDFSDSKVMEMCNLAPGIYMIKVTFDFNQMPFDSRPDNSRPEQDPPESTCTSVCRPEHNLHSEKCMKGVRG